MAYKLWQVDIEVRADILVMAYKLWRISYGILVMASRHRSAGRHPNGHVKGPVYRRALRHVYQHMRRDTSTGVWSRYSIMVYI